MLRRAIGLVALLAATVLAGASSGRTAAPGTTALLARYEPVLHLYRADWRPSAVEPFLAAADLERLIAGNWRFVRRSPPASALANGSSQLRLNTRGCTPALYPDSCYPRRAVTPTVYGRAWVNPTASAGIATVLEYWLFYSLDDWRNSPTKPGLWHMHEGDWEEVSVALDAAGHPVSVAASQHDLGVTRPWARTRRVGTHPVVFVALGSHANYLSPGYQGASGVPHVIEPRFSGLPLTEPDYTSTQTSVGPAGTAATGLRLVDISSGGAPWLTFAGDWGDGTYILVGSRGAFTHLRIGDSPPGPAFHAVWRDPLLQFRSWPADDGH
jgi:hypothetical protein